MAYLTGPNRVNAIDYGTPLWAGHEAVNADMSAFSAHLRAGHWFSANECLRLAQGAITDLQAQLVIAQEQQELQERIEKESASGI